MITQYFITGAVMAFVLGLCFGSFLNVCIYRMPRGLSVVHPGSMCPGCRTPIAPYDNVPVLSWLVLGGRCRRCRQPITPRYMAVELLVALLFVACYYLELGTLVPAVKDAIFCFLVVGLIFTDAETQLLPDKLTLSGLVLGLLFSFAVPVTGVFLLLWRPTESHLAFSLRSFADAVLGAALGSGFIYFAGWLYKRIRGGEGMGFGDVKLMAMVGAFLGVGPTALTLALACIAGALFGLCVLAQVYRKRRQRYQRVLPAAQANARAFQAASMAMRGLPIPFGVFLGGAALVALFVADRIVYWYFNLFRV